MTRAFLTAIVIALMVAGAFSLLTGKSVIEVVPGLTNPGREDLPITTSEIEVRTDKLEYRPGEIVSVTVKNLLNDTVISHAGSSTPVFSIHRVERLEPDGSWKKLYAQCEYPHCTYKVDSPVVILTGKADVYKWNLLVYLNGTRESFPAGPGTYRLIVRYQVGKDPSMVERNEWLGARSNDFKVVAP